MRIVVAGASGLIGSRVVRILRQAGHDVVEVSRGHGVDIMDAGRLLEIARGASVLIDVTHAGSFGSDDALRFFRQAGRNLLKVSAAVGVRNYVLLSLTATDRLIEADYFRAKLVQENLAMASGLPITVIRATQFHELLHSVIATGENNGTIRLPRTFIRPICADEVAKLVAQTALGAGGRGTLEVAGPEILALADVAREILAFWEDPRPVFEDVEATYFGVPIGEMTLLPSEVACVGNIRFHDWLVANHIP
ncbi:SDR family oxidoreductase [Agrobacterium tumefaciens]|uniref:SDR family oxidoreductase n=1 Tax=Agrobacterium tumefaciens TaxID=358 RepID=UPI003B9E5070